jgi:integrase
MPDIVLKTEPANLPETSAPNREAVSLRQAVESLWSYHLRDKDPDTRRAYEGDWADIAAHLAAAGVITGPDPLAAVAVAISAGSAGAAALVRDFVAARKGSYAPATIHRRVYALRSLLADARVQGMIDWTLDRKAVGRLPHLQTYKDTRGCGMEGFRKILAACDGDSARCVRDRALVWLLFAMTLRRNSVSELNVGDFLDDPQTPEILVTLKGNGAEKTRKSIESPRVARALREWAAIRGGAEHEPLFVGILPDGKFSRRLGGGMIWKICDKLGRAGGVRRRNPHGFRHAGATEALRKTGDLAAVQSMLDHRTATHTIRYLDNLKQIGASASRAVAEAV